MKKETLIVITAKFGSKFQKSFAETSLTTLLKEWRRFLNASHKKNKIDIKINNDDIKNLDWFNF